MRKIKVQDWSKLKVGNLYYIVGIYDYGEKKYWIIEITKPYEHAPNHINGRYYPINGPNLTLQQHIDKIVSYPAKVYTGPFFEYGRPNIGYKLEIYGVTRSLREKYKTYITSNSLSSPQNRSSYA